MEETTTERVWHADAPDVDMMFTLLCCAAATCPTRISAASWGRIWRGEGWEKCRSNGKRGHGREQNGLNFRPICAIIKMNMTDSDIWILRIFTCMEEGVCS